MAIPSQLLPLPFAGGLNEKVDSRWTQPGTLTGVTNGVFAKDMQIRKRFGYVALAKDILPDDGTISAGVKLANLRSTLLLIDGHNVYSRNETIDKWANLDRVPELHAWREPRVEWPQTTANYDIGFNGSHLIIVWSAFDFVSSTVHSVYATVIEYATGEIVYANKLLTPAGADFPAVRVVTVDDANSVPYAIVIYIDGTSGVDLYARTLNLNTMVWGSATQIITDYDNTAADFQLWDAAPIVGGTEFVVVFPRFVAPASRETCIVRYDTALTLANFVVYGPPAGHVSPGHAYSICADSGENIFTGIIYDDGLNSHVYVGARSPTGAMAQVLAETSLGFTITGTGTNRIGICRRSSTQATCIFSSGGASVGARWASITTAGVVSSSARQAFEVVLAGKPFVQDGRCYAGLASLVTLTAFGGTPPVSITANQGAYWLCDITGDGSGTQQSVRPVTNIGPRIANTTGTAASANFVVTNAAQISSTRWAGIGSFAGSISTRFSLQSMIYNFADDTYPRWQNVELGDVLFAAGGVTSQFDGSRWTEVGFLHPPPTISVVGSNGAGALTPLGVYQYYAWYEWTDAKGQIQRSASAIGSVAMGAADDTATITVNHCAITTKQDVESLFNPVISLRLARNTNGGSTFFVLYGDGAAPANSPNSLSQNITDLVADTTLDDGTFGQWWASGGFVEGYAPPGFLLLEVHNNRLVGLGDDRTTLWFSTEYSTETVGEQVRFSDSFRVVVADGGAVTAIKSMDGRLYVFKEASIYVIDGNGWNETGTQSDLQLPRSVTAEQGAIDQRSVVRTHQGIYFQSKRGLHLLSRGGEVSYVGAAVEDRLDANPVIRSSAVYSRNNEIRWECSASETSTTGVTLVYNYFFDRWSTFERFGESTSGRAAVSSNVVSNRFYWLSSGGTAYQEHVDSTATNAFFDDTEWVTFSIESCWAKGPGGINGWQRWRYVSFVAESKTPADIVVSAGFDGDTTYDETERFLASDVSAWTTPLTEAQFQFGNQKASMVRVKLNDATPTGASPGTGQGPVFIGLVLDVAVLPGRKRLAPAQST